MPKKPAEQKEYLLSLEELRARLVESEDALRAIHSGEVDALVVPGQAGEQVFTLKGADRTFRVLIEDMNEGALTLTAEGIILYANRRLGEMLKSPIEKIIGSSIHAWIAPESTKTLQELLRRDDKQTRRRGEVMLIASDGTFMPGYLSLNMLQLEDMQGYFCMVATDLTEQKSIASITAAEELAQQLLAASEQSRLVLLSMIEDQQRVSDALQESEERYRSLVENINDIIYTLDTSGAITYVSPVIERMSHHRAEELIGRDFSSLVHPEDLPELMKKFSATLAGEIGEYEFRLIDRDGSVHYVRTSSKAVIKNGVVAGLNAVLTEITERKRAEDKIHALLASIEDEKTKLTSLINSITDEVWFADTSGKFTIVNPLALKRFNLAKDQEFEVDKLAKSLVVLRPDGSVRPVEEAPPLRALLGEVVINQEEIVQIPETGEFRNRQVNASPVKDAEGTIIGSVAVVRDITERIRAEEAIRESELRYRTMADTGQALIWMSGTDKKCDYFNKIWLTFTGRTLEQELGDGWIEGIHEDDLERCVATYVAAFDKREPFSMVYRLRRNDGEFRWILDDGMPRYDTKGVFIGYIGHCLDITERKMAEEELARLNRELEQRVMDRTAEMEKANRELESFSYTVSHDLRAPLRHINGFVTMFRNEVGEIANEKARHYMEVISESAGRMGQLIDDLLSFSRMGRTELTIRTVDIGKLADEVLAGFSEEIGEKNIIVTRGCLPLVQGDEAMLRVVLTNLISNAVKFTSRTENRKIDIGCDSQNGESICHVKDNGAGFDMRYVDKLFGVFQRLHSEKDFEGTGIGLATVKRIVQHHGGRVWAEGDVDRGARFYFSLPAGNPGPMGDQASAEA
jgi:PAS domain S-box-containing protein